MIINYWFDYLPSSTYRYSLIEALQSTDKKKEVSVIVRRLTNTALDVLTRAKELISEYESEGDNTDNNDSDNEKNIGAQLRFLGSELERANKDLIAKTKQVSS